jgi:cytochrome b-561
MWGYGFLKLVPSWMSFDLFGVHVSSEFVGGLVLPGLVFAAVAVWPFLDYEPEPTHFAANPLDRPPQTAVGVAAVAFVMIASLAGMDVIVADLLGTTTDAIKPALIGLLVAGPAVAGGITYAVLAGYDGDDPGGPAPTAADGGELAAGRGTGHAPTGGDDETTDGETGDGEGRA